MTTKHTPGPWHIDGRGEIRGADESVIVSPVADLAGDFDYVAPTDADAHLIAAAPDLLHVAEMVVRGDAADGALYGFAKAALDKAKGKT